MIHSNIGTEKLHFRRAGRVRVRRLRQLCHHIWPGADTPQLQTAHLGGVASTNAVRRIPITLVGSMRVAFPALVLACCIRLCNRNPIFTTDCRPPLHDRGTGVIDDRCVCVLGLLGLQARALSFQRASFDRRTAAEMVAQSAERVRANHMGLVSGSYAGTFTRHSDTDWIHRMRCVHPGATCGPRSGSMVCRVSPSQPGVGRVFSMEPIRSALDSGFDRLA